MKSQKCKFGFAVAVFYSSLCLYGNPSLHNRIANDETLIIPGIGAEKVLIDENVGSVQKRLRTPLRTMRLVETEELFYSIFQLQVDCKILFDEIHYYGQECGIVFFNNKTVVAIGGISKNRVTDAGILLEKGIQNFIFHYGNDGLRIFAKGKHKAYFYVKKGIAIFDDDGNDDIDLYLIFKPKIM